MFKTVTNNLAIGSIAESEALQEIAQKGYKTIIDLCPASEGNQLDVSMVKELALEYVSVPVSPKNLTIETLEAFKQVVKASPQPIYTRCASGLRAGVFTLLVLAEQEGWTEAQYLEKFQTLGIEQKPNSPLENFAHTYFEQNKRENLAVN
ncbi:beta-lactamase hydrolase domain-containing protein [Nostoc sp.]|uniref:beta-lactamase hydrolase domain-containing protein n=1 Tax=Nostoc sp. TaxID=1180 RepID=UPI002FF76498